MIDYNSSLIHEHCDRLYDAENEVDSWDYEEPRDIYEFFPKASRYDEETGLLKPQFEGMHYVSKLGESEF